MHIRECDRISSKIIIMLEMFFLISAIISAIICGVNKPEEYMWSLPMAFGVCFYFAVFMRKHVLDNIFIIIMVGILYIRDVITPVLFYCLNAEPWSLGINYDHYSTLYNIQPTITIMLLELFATFLIIGLLSKKYTVSATAEYGNERGSILIAVVAVLGILVIIIEPYYLGIYDMLFQFYDYEVVSYKAILLSIAIVIVTVFFMVAIKRRNGMPDIVKVCLTGVVWSVFCVEASLGANQSHPISRWGFLLNLLVGGIMLMWLYPSCKKILLGSLGAVGVIGIGVLSVFRGFDATMFFCYTNFNDYIAGPTNVSFAVDMCQSGNFDIGFRTLLGDVFANVPVINHFLQGDNNMIIYFSKTVYGLGSVQYDKIVPFSGQMYGYFSYLGVAIGNAVSTFAALYAGYWAKRIKNMYVCYAVLFAALLFSLSTIFNLSILCQYLSITILPILVISVADALVGRMLRNKLLKERQ